jgi:hypothetical protein
MFFVKSFSNFFDPCIHFRNELLILHDTLHRQLVIFRIHICKFNTLQLHLAIALIIQTLSLLKVILVCNLILCLKDLQLFALKQLFSRVEFTICLPEDNRSQHQKVIEL